MAKSVYLGKLVYGVTSESGWGQKVVGVGRVVKIQKDGFMVVFSNDRNKKEHYYKFDSIDKKGGIIFTTQSAAEKNASGSIW